MAIQFYFPRTKVEFGDEHDGAIKGVVLSVQVKPAPDFEQPAILYEIGYLDGATWRELWLPAFLVKSLSPLEPWGFASNSPKSIE